jgi:ubiquinone/menaquinone biosynthesis C-methylase UbiE
MPTPLRPRKNENPSTYFVQDRKNQKELARLAIQDRLLTAGMGGVLSEQPDPTAFRRVLDVGCGTGSWLIGVAQTYPEMSLVGIDISQRMIKYARAQAEAYHLQDRIEFYVMDALGPLDFPPATFDLVDLRLGASFVRIWDWPKMLSELLRVTCPGGVVRVTESEACPQSNSPALAQYFEMLQYALFRGCHLFRQESTGMTSELVRLFNQHSWEKVQTKACTIEYRAGMQEQEAFCENVKLVFQTTRQFIQKWGGISKDYDAICQRASHQMQQPDFYARWNLLTVWGSKP